MLFCFLRAPPLHFLLLIMYGKTNVRHVNIGTIGKREAPPDGEASSLCVRDLLGITDTETLDGFDDFIAPSCTADITELGFTKIVYLLKA